MIQLGEPLARAPAADLHASGHPSLEIAETRPKGRYHTTTPKSGRTRRVQMSERLVRALREHQMAEGRPPSDQSVAYVTPTHYNRRISNKAKEAARIGPEITPHSLRHTYASQLLTAGIQLPYIARQLGHSSISTTKRCYARWSAGDGYCEPLDLEQGEVPADLLSKVQSGTTFAFNSLC